MFEGISYHLQYSVRSALAVGVWKERQMKGAAGRVVFVCFFYRCCICSHLPSKGLTKETILVKLFFGPLGHTIRFALSRGAQKGSFFSTVKHFKSTSSQN